MLDNIVDVARSLPVQETPTPTEKSQIVLNMMHAPTSILRFNSVKQGRAAYDKLKKAKPGSRVEIKDGMYEVVVAVDAIIAICFVDHAKRAKFIPIP